MNTPITILYLANSGDIIGGGQISLLSLLKGLNRDRFNPVIVCPAEGGLSEALKRMNVETYIIKMGTLRKLDIFSWIQSIYKMVKIIREKSVHIIHSNGSRATIYGGLAARLTRTPLIWHVRIADSDRLLDTLLAKLSSHIVAISEAVQKRFCWIVNSTKDTTVIYNGVDTKEFNPAIDGSGIREEFGISPETPLIGTVGRMDWYKGHEYFIHAAAQVIEKIPNAHFLIVGDGENRKSLITLVQNLHLSNQVFFAGNRDDVPQILACLDLFVLSSVSEGFGRAAAEAMACAKPVVATTAGGLPEVVENGITGKLVHPRDSSALAAAILEMIGDRERAQRMGVAGRRRVETLFSIEQNISRTEKLYESMLIKYN